MEIRSEEVIQTTDHPIELFYSALNNPATRRNYTNMLKKIMCEYLKPIIKVDATLVQQEQKKKKGFFRVIFFLQTNKVQALFQMYFSSIL